MIDVLEITEKSEYLLSVTYDFYRADVKWDGCVHLWIAHTIDAETGERDEDYVHICELRRLIEYLQQLEILAKENFGKEWP